MQLELFSFSLNFHYVLIQTVLKDLGGKGVGDPTDERQRI